MEETIITIGAVKEEVRLCDWAAQIEAQQASGMTVQRWCEENGIKPKTYYYHLRKHREKCTASVRIEILNMLLNVSLDLLQN